MRSMPIATVICLPTLVLGQQIVEIPPPDGFSFTIVEDVSDDGAIVVGFATAEGRDRSAIRWTASTGSQLLRSPPGFDARSAIAVSADGSTILGNVKRPNGEHRAVLWKSNGSIQFIDAPPDVYDVWAADLSHDGRIAVGYAGFADGMTRAWRWSIDAGWRVLAQPDGFHFAYPGVLSGDGKQTFGVVANDPSPIVPCKWDAQGDVQLLPVPAGIEQFRPNDVNEDGSFVAGWAFDAYLEPKPLFWSESSGYMELADFGDLRTYGSWALSPDGTVWLDNPRDNAFLWREDLGIYQFEDVLAARGLRFPGLRMQYVQAVSPDGTAIIGHGDDRPSAGKGVDRAWLITGFRLPSGCLPDIDLNEALDAFDYLAFINRFNAGDARADVDGDGALTLADFLAFRAAFDAGC